MKAFTLQALDEQLAKGAVSFGLPFARAQVGFVQSRQMTDGGFAGRKGDSDIYYTDFAVRSLVLLKSEDAILARVVGYLRGLPPSPRDVIDCFNRLNLACQLRSRGFDCMPDENACRAALKAQELASGGWSRPGQSAISAYHTFLAVLCGQMLRDDADGSIYLSNQLACLKQRDGGYAETMDQPAGQTAATAAAVLTLGMRSSLARKDVESTIEFLKRMQAPDGGFFAHADAPASDLLATFVASTALAVLGALPHVDRVGIARFVRRTAFPSGGFRDNPMDGAPDVEYTYYGIATLALLNQDS
jgi:geranylgeranyl transferase type-2 subunit beta